MGSREPPAPAEDTIYLRGVLGDQRNEIEVLHFLSRTREVLTLQPDQRDVRVHPSPSLGRFHVVRGCDLVPTLLLGVTLSVSGAVLGTNVISGFAQGDPLGWALATIAGWGIVATWVISWSAWPLLADPAREARPIGERGRLAALLVLAQPRRMAGLAAVLFVVLAISTIAFAAVVTISVAFSALVACRLVLPAADRLESSLGAREAARRSSSD